MSNEIGGDNKNMKKYLPAAVFIIVVILSFVLTDLVLQIKSEDGIKQAKEFYYQPKDTIDVVFLGSSHIHCNVNTAVLWKNYGIAAYDYSAAEQPLWITYHYFKEMLKSQSPKLVVIDMFTPARYKEYYRYRWIMDNLYGMRFSKNKLDMMQVAVEDKLFWDYFPSYFGYHSRYDEIGSKDLKYVIRTPKEKRAFKGFVPYFERRPLEEPEILNNSNILLEAGNTEQVQEDASEAGNTEQMQEDASEPGNTEEISEGLSERSREYLLKIIELAKANDIELLFMVTPYEILKEDMPAYDEIEQIAQDSGINFWNYNLNYKEFDLDYSKDFNDFSHLNYDGSVKFTNFLGQNLKESYTLEDHRGENIYLSWDENVSLIETMAVENPIVTVIE